MFCIPGGNSRKPEHKIVASLYGSNKYHSNIESIDLFTMSRKTKFHSNSELIISYYKDSLFAFGKNYTELS